jgi:hypothetical protein
VSDHDMIVGVYLPAAPGFLCVLPDDMCMIARAKSGEESGNRLVALLVGERHGRV